MSEKYILVKDAIHMLESTGTLCDFVKYLLENPYCPTYTHADILAGQWVPVSERLPTNAGESVIVRFDGKLDQNISAQGALQIGCFWPDEQKWDIEGWPIALGTVTHWMPLPQPPKEEGKK